MTNSKNLLFLLAAAPMGMGACISVPDPFESLGGEVGGDGDGDTSGTGDEVSDSSGDTTTGDGDGDPTGDGDGDGDPTGDGDGDGDPGDGDGDPTTGDGDGDGDTVCTGYAAKVGECYGAQYVDAAYMACTDYLTQYYEAYGAECRDAFEGALVCVSALTCEELAGEDPVCVDEQMAAEAACQ